MREKKPIYIMPKPVGPMCNLACEYCYYLEKENLFNKVKKPRMSAETLELYVRQYIEAQPGDNVLFTWHGGEPLLAGIDFYEKAIELQKKYGAGKNIENSIQTNGTLLTEEWCKLFRKYNFLVGISIDGPQRFHDEYRMTKGGKPTFFSVMKGIQLLRKYGIEWNAMATVNEYNADHPVEFYRFFKNLGCRYLQFSPIVERLNPDESLSSMGENGELADFSITPKQWGDFLCILFQEWVKEDVGKIFIQIFDATLANWVGVEPGLCVLSESCGHAGVMEHNGDVYSCDHFVFPQYRLGNIHDKSITELMHGNQQIEFGKLKDQHLSAKCKSCEFLFACHGECPRNRFVKETEGDFAQNYLCEGYKMFFSMVAPYMDFMKRELEAGRPPANVMKANI